MDRVEQGRKNHPLIPGMDPVEQEEHKPAYSDVQQRIVKVVYPGGCIRDLCVDHEGNKEKRPVICRGTVLDGKEVLGKGSWQVAEVFQKRCALMHEVVVVKVGKVIENSVAVEREYAEGYPEVGTQPPCENSRHRCAETGWRHEQNIHAGGIQRKV